MAMGAPIPAIQAENLTKKFGHITAVNDISFHVNPGEIFSLVGPDGAGKTTTLRMLASIMDPTYGKVLLSGHDISRDAAAAKDHLAYMSQRFGLYRDLTVIENIQFYADLYGVSGKERKTRIEELLGFSNMSPFKKRRAQDLSGGMKQKLQLICALIHTPRVLLLDEPTNGVDPLSRRDFWKILYRLLKEKVAILVTTAYLDEAERSDRLALMDHGKILVLGTPAEIKQRMEGKILSIRSRESRKINRLLQNKPGTLSVNVFGDMVHVVGEDIDGIREHSRARLSEAAIQYDEIKEIPPTIEDVFVSLLGRNKRRKDPEDFDAETDIIRPPGSDKRLSQIPAVTVERLTRRFGDFTAVDNVSFEVPQGEIFGFLGPNGAGKSTTIRMLCGLLKPTSGSGAVAGYDIHTRSEEIKQHIGYMSQKFSLFEDLSVEENIDFFGGIYGLSGKKLGTRKEWAIEMAGLKDHRKSLTSILSGGWRQRLSLACAILHEPPIIFLDEPTSGVDPISRRSFWDLIYEMADQGVTTFVTTHYLEEAEYCNRIALIYDGSLIAMDSPQALKTRFMEEEILNLRCDTPQEVMAYLEQLPEIREVALFGAGLHIVTKDATLAEKKIRSTLAQLDIRVEHMEIIPPGMEDVFVSLIERADERKVNGNGAPA